MRSLPLIFCIILSILVISWLGVVFATHSQLGDLEPMSESYAFDEANENYMEGTAQEDEALFPRKAVGLANQGKKVYISLGCIYCHTQQVRRRGFGADFERGWGDRQSVPRDYIRQSRVLLGTMRTGPDLMNIGQRNPSPEWHHLHLYNPLTVSDGSTMPPFSFLYELRDIRATGPSGDALHLSGAFAPEPGTEVVPTRRAKSLVDYLLSLRLDYYLPEVSRPSQ